MMAVRLMQYFWMYQRPMICKIVSETVPLIANTDGRFREHPSSTDRPNKNNHINEVLYTQHTVLHTN